MHLIKLIFYTILLDDATNQIPLAPVDLNGVASLASPFLRGTGGRFGGWGIVKSASL
jgi:hypothetical protein